MHLPCRVVKPGTFAKYREWEVKVLCIVFGVETVAWLEFYLSSQIHATGHSVVAASWMVTG